MCKSVDIGKFRPHKDAKLIVVIQDQILEDGICCSGVLGQNF